MPKIQSSTDLRNNYNEISTFCNTTGEPVFITKNGRGDLAVMSIDLYDKLIQKDELYRLLAEAEDDFKLGREMSFDESMASLRKGVGDGTL
ncbi:MAG: type II toxin-antitoxin system Phd/YefM family antitoxin [Saccharofermentanales bacterium]|jgi:prevent-host-death family protein